MEDDIFLKHFRTVNNLTDEEFDNLFEGEGDQRKLKKDAGKIMADIDKKRVDNIKAEALKGTPKWDDVYKSAEAKIKKKIEEDFQKNTGYKAKEGEKLEDMYINYGVQQKESKEITEAEVRKHPAFIKREEEITEEWKGKFDQKEKEFEDYKNTVKEKTTFAEAKKVFKNEFLKLNPVLSEDKSKAERQVEHFLDSLRGKVASFQLGDNGDVTMLDNEGKRLEDGHGNRLTANMFVKQHAEPIFDFQKQGTKGNAGNEDGQAVEPGRPQKFEYQGVTLSKVPTTKEERNYMMNRAKGKEVLAIDAAYEQFGTDREE